MKLDPRASVDAGRVERMGDTLAHRGPDGAGTWVQGSVGLAHRRLAIVDVDGGSQPMCNEDGTVWIVFNGEIYNHAALRSELEARGHRYRTRSDTETIVHLYEEEGERCVERLQGMFAFALWDARRNDLLLARDRLGIKPLYYALTDGELVFGSEVKALLATGLRAELHTGVLPEFLASGFVAGRETFFRHVTKLLPGRTLAWSARGGLRERRYWQPPVATQGAGGTLADQAHELRDRLTRTVESHLMSDVPLGVFLSGGVDSTGIAALAARMAPDRLGTFSVGFAAPEADELAYARLAAQALGTEHHEVVVSPAEFFHALPSLVWHEDEPLAFPSSVPLYFVSRLARRHVKVVLTGEGADELFLGYNRYRLTAWNRRLGRLLWAAPPRLRRAVERAVMAVAGPARRYLQRTFLALSPDLKSLVCENFAVFPTLLQKGLLRDAAPLEARDPYAAALACLGEGGGELDLLDCMSRADLQTYLVELLMKQDQMSMAASVESRVPFLDHLLVEHAVAVPSRFKLRGVHTKAVLRAALSGLVPQAILKRRKMGFPVPLARWLRGPFSSVLRSLVLSPRALERGLFEPRALSQMVDEHRAGVRDHAQRLWLLMGLELWMRIFLDNENPADLATSCAS